MFGCKKAKCHLQFIVRRPLLCIVDRNNIDAIPTIHDNKNRQDLRNLLAVARQGGWKVAMPWEGQDKYHAFSSLSKLCPVPQHNDLFHREGSQELGCPKVSGMSQFLIFSAASHSELSHGQLTHSYLPTHKRARTHSQVNTWVWLWLKIGGPSGMRGMRLFSRVRPTD